MVLVKVLERRDAASVVVAVAVGLVVATFVSTVTTHLSGVLTGADTVGGFRENYWHPLVAFVLQLVALELLARLAVIVRAQLVSKR